MVAIDGVLGYDNLQVSIADGGTSWILTASFKALFNPDSIIEYIGFYMEATDGSGNTFGTKQPWLDDGYAHPSLAPKVSEYDYLGAGFYITKGDSIRWKITYGYHTPNYDSIRYTGETDLVLMTTPSGVGIIDLMPSAVVLTNVKTRKSNTLHKRRRSSLQPPRKYLDGWYRSDYATLDTPTIINVLTDSTLGNVYGFNTDWSIGRNSATGNVLSGNSSFGWNTYIQTVDSNYVIRRGVFDIPSGVTAVAGSVIRFRRTIGMYDGTLFALTRDVSGTINAGDYNNFGVTALAPKAVYTDEYVTFLLNTDGVNYINGGGVSFMVRSDADLDDIAPISDNLYIDSDWTELYYASKLPATEYGVLSLQNKSNLLTLANFTQVNTVNQFLLGSNGGLVSPAGISAMLVPFAGNQTLTKLSFGGWMKVPNLAAPTGGDRFYALISNWNLFTDNVADEGFRIGIFNSVVFRVDYCNGVNYRFINTPVVSLPEFNNLYANKYVHIFSTFENGLAKLYLNAVLVASTQMSITSVKTNTTVQQIYLGRSITNSAYVPTNTELDGPQLFFNDVITQDQLRELILTDQQNHKHLR